MGNLCYTAAMKNDAYEIERKFLIRYPDLDYLRQNAESSQIVQTYLLSRKGETARVRKRGREGAWVYTHTVKQRLSDLRRIEREREISEKEYQDLLKSADPARKPIVKTRWCLPYNGKLFEIDVFPFWKDRAYMEIELADEAEPVELPPEIRVIREVTGDRRYTNAALAREIPYDVI